MHALHSMELKTVFALQLDEPNQNSVCNAGSILLLQSPLSALSSKGDNPKEVLFFHKLLATISFHYESMFKDYRNIAASCLLHMRDLHVLQHKLASIGYPPN